MIVMDSAGIHPFLGERPPYEISHAMGDVEELVFMDKHKSVFISPPAKEEKGPVAHLVVRIMLDKEKLPLPQVDPHIKNLREYYNILPRRGTVYAMRNGYLVNYTLEDLRRDWNSLFTKNAAYRHIAKQRYKTAKQALIEFHSNTDRGNRFFQTLVRGLYGRFDAYTEQLGERVLFGAAIVLEWPKMFKTSIPIASF